MDKIEIPFGAYDSETLGWTYTIPNGYTVKIEDGKIVVKKEELEDEKIRKELIDFIQWAEDRGMTRHDYHQAKKPAVWIAYLEKQKEVELTEEDKKIIPEALVMLCDDIINHRVHTPIKTNEEGARKIKTFLKTINRQPHKSREEWEKQKPAEWSEFDRGVLEDAICATDLLGNGESFNKGNPNLAKAFRIAKDWLKSLPERFNLQPKQEWSEEDEKMFKNIRDLLLMSSSNLNSRLNGRIDAIGDREYSSLQFQIAQCLSWLEYRLKSLRPQQDRCKDCPHRGDMFLLTQGFKSGKNELAIRFMNYLDENRPEGKMGLSNSECEDIDKAFKEIDWKKIMRYAEKYLPH